MIRFLTTFDYSSLRDYLVGISIAFAVSVCYVALMEFFSGLNKK